MSFKKDVKESYVAYELEAELTSKLCESIAMDIKQDLLLDPTYEAVVFAFKEHDLDSRAFKILTPLGLELRKRNKRMCALSENNLIHSLIRQEGMDKIFLPISKLADLHPESLAKKVIPKLDVNFINPFVEGTLHVLNIQCQTKAIPQKPILKSGSNFHCPIDIAGIIGITSKSFQGSIAICFPADIFLGLMSKMLGEEFKTITDDLNDGAGELTNMIFGHAKKILNENGHTIEKALPSVVRAPNLKIDHITSQQSMILPFLVEEKMFFMEIGLG